MNGNIEVTHYKCAPARVSGNGNDNPNTGKFINIYPNPVSGNATIEYLLPESAETGNLEIYDETGRKITEYYFDNENGSFIINTNTYNPGIYVYKFVSEDTKETGRLIILK